MDNSVRFWGVRGSTPSPGPSTAGVGGNTSCVEVRVGGEQIIIDGGTGLRALGSNEAGKPLKSTILFSHMHWDHIQGIPFFSPLYHPQSQFVFVGPEGLEEILKTQMSFPTFPVGMEALGASIEFVVVQAGDAFHIGEVEVQTFELNHPGKALGYRLNSTLSSVTYLCDHEHTDSNHAPDLIDFARGSDMVIYDGQFLPEEYPEKRGWGHSTYEKGAEFGLECGAQLLYLTHHEPMRTDVDIAQIEINAQKIFPQARVAREGPQIALGRAGMSVNRSDPSSTSVLTQI